MRNTSGVVQALCGDTERPTGPITMQPCVANPQVLEATHAEQAFAQEYSQSVNK